jgi:hypothetical protein
MRRPRVPGLALAQRDGSEILSGFQAFDPLEEPAMSQAANDDRRFRVHARHAGPHFGRIVHEPSFEAAAVAYVEDLAIAPEDGGEISVVVRDLDTHHEHCFRIDLETGETAACS